MARSSSTKTRGKVISALGLMSGTSLDGIDVAAIESDGEAWIATGPALTMAYPSAFRERLRAVLGGVGDVAGARFRGRHSQTRFELIGFHGHTILHAPAERRTWQIGDGALLARLTGCD